MGVRQPGGVPEGACLERADTHLHREQVTQ